MVQEVTVTVPQVTFTARLTAFTPETFTLTVQQQYIAALQAASPTVDNPHHAHQHQGRFRGRGEEPCAAWRC